MSFIDIFCFLFKTIKHYSKFRGVWIEKKSSNTEFEEHYIENKGDNTGTSSNARELNCKSIEQTFLYLEASEKQLVLHIHTWCKFIILILPSITSVSKYILYYNTVCNRMWHQCRVTHFGEGKVLNL